MPPLTVAAAAAGASHSLFLLSDGRVAAVGRGDDGQLGMGDAEPREAPEVVQGVGKARAVVAGAEFSLAVVAGDGDDDDKLWGWGWADFGRLGSATRGAALAPALVRGLPTPLAVAAVAAGDAHAVVALAGGAVYAFGRNSTGALGLGDTADRAAPTLVPSLPPVRSVAAGAEHSVFATVAGDVYAAGWNGHGPIGDGGRTDSATPVCARVVGPANGGPPIVTVAAGWRHTLAIDASRELWAWGWNGWGQLGVGAGDDGLEPAKVGGPLAGVPVASASGGWRHTLAVDGEGRLYAWGWGAFGQTARGADRSDAPLPVPVPMPAAVACVAAGWRHSLAVAGGDAFAFGRNVDGQCGAVGAGGGADAAAPLPPSRADVDRPRVAVPASALAAGALDGRPAPPPARVAEVEADAATVPDCDSGGGGGGGVGGGAKRRRD